MLTRSKRRGNLQRVSTHIDKRVNRCLMPTSFRGGVGDVWGGSTANTTYSLTPFGLVCFYISLCSHRHCVCLDTPYPSRRHVPELASC